jgi:hypothetical protein
MKKVQKICLRMLTVLVVSLGFAAAAPAGELEPPGPPGPTMKTLDEIPPTWSQILPVSERFQLVMNDLAVLDKETGLVWERSPDSSQLSSWESAVEYAYRKKVAGRGGWRLPTIEELHGLIYPLSPPFPPGHPFTVLETQAYWSSTTSTKDPAYAWYVAFNNGVVITGLKSSPRYVWCVRGGHGHDGQ